jgi:hypothetical protein
MNICAESSLKLVESDFSDLSDLVMPMLNFKFETRIVESIDTMRQVIYGRYGIQLGGSKEILLLEMHNFFKELNNTTFLNNCIKNIQSNIQFYADSGGEIKNPNAIDFELLKIILKLNHIINDASHLSNMIKYLHIEHSINLDRVIINVTHLSIFYKLFLLFIQNIRDEEHVILWIAFFHRMNLQLSTVWFDLDYSTTFNSVNFDGLVSLILYIIRDIDPYEFPTKYYDYYEDNDKNINKNVNYPHNTYNIVVKITEYKQPKSVKPSNKHSRPKRIERQSAYVGRVGGLNVKMIRNRSFKKKRIVKANITRHKKR